MEDIEREAFPGVSAEVRVDEIVSSSEEIPSIVKLDAPQPREFMLLILGAENIVGSSYREEGSRANSTDGEVIVLDGEGIHDSRVESGHEVVRVGEMRNETTWGCVWILEVWVNIYPLHCQVPERKSPAISSHSSIRLY